MGRTLTTDKRGEFWRDRIEIIDPPCSEFDPSTDLNDTSQRRVRMLSPYTESFDGRVDATPPFDLPNPSSIQLGMTDSERTRPIRNDDREDY